VPLSAQLCLQVLLARAGSLERRWRNLRLQAVTACPSFVFQAVSSLSDTCSLRFYSKLDFSALMLSLTGLGLSCVFGHAALMLVQLPLSDWLLT
jgi:hypothetical protein